MPETPATAPKVASVDIPETDRRTPFVVVTRYGRLSTVAARPPPVRMTSAGRPLSPRRRISLTWYRLPTAWRQGVSGSIVERAAFR